MITIVTDSSVYMKKEEAASLGIRVIPLAYSADGIRYTESFSDENGDFEQLLKDSKSIVTMHPHASVFLSVFGEELAKGNQVLFLSISSRLSASYNTAAAVKKNVMGANVEVFDSQLAAGGLYLLVKETVKLAKEVIDLNTLLSKLSAIRARISIKFSVGDLTPLRNSGRMGMVRSGYSTILNRRPILTCKDGAIVEEGVAGGTAEMVQSLVRSVPSDVSEIVINYVGENHFASNLYHMIQAAHEGVSIRLEKLGPAMAAHVGLKALSVSCIRG
ncbi:DegV domain-containing protein [Clostridia bacterium]|nr:DegV domain-containing protein [Clostridia bacterium]